MKDEGTDAAKERRGDAEKRVASAEHPRVSASPFLRVRRSSFRLHPFRARRQAAKAPGCKPGTREFESHRALQK